MGDGIPDVLLSMASSPSSLFIVQVSMLANFLHQWETITSNSIVHDLLKVYHLQLRCDPPLFSNFRWFNIKPATAHHPEGGG